MDLDSIERICSRHHGGTDQVTVNDPHRQRPSEGRGQSRRGLAQRYVNLRRHTASNDVLSIASTGSENRSDGSVPRHRRPRDEGRYPGRQTASAATTIDASGLASRKIGIEVNGARGAAQRRHHRQRRRRSRQTADAARTRATRPPATTPSYGTKATGSDTVGVRRGSTPCSFHGANVSSETIDNLGPIRRARPALRDVANITMDINGMERIDISVLGRCRQVTVNDRRGTGTKQGRDRTSGRGGGRDGQKIRQPSTAPTRTAAAAAKTQARAPPAPR